MAANNKEIVTSQLPEFLDICSQISSNTDNVSGLVESLTRKTANHREELSSGGISLLRLRNKLLLDYLVDLNNVLLRKVSGESIDPESGSSKSVERLVTARTYLEKTKPIEKKLKHQIERALKIAEEGLDKSDPLGFKPDLKAFGSDSEDEEGDSEDEDKETSGSAVGKYVAPKHIPAHFDGDAEDKEDADAKKESRKKREFLSKSMIEDLKRQHLDTPEEILEFEDSMKRKKVQMMRERTRYEEENFMRLPKQKKEKKSKGREFSTMGSLGDEVTYFGRDSFTGGASGGKKRKAASGGGGKKKFKKFKKK